MNQKEAQRLTKGSRVLWDRLQVYVFEVAETPGHVDTYNPFIWIQPVNGGPRQKVYYRELRHYS